MTKRFQHSTCKTSGLVLLMLFFISSYTKAQSFATMRVNTQHVYKQQPIRASITIYTSTWFTDSPDLGTIHVPNSFVLPFKRTQSGIQYVNNKQYATLEFFYLIFPYESGEITIPELSISISTPPEGDYIGVKRNLKTKPINLLVKEEPEGFSGVEWLVAKNVSISDKWNKALNDVKVGEVIERTITIRATGTLPAFIPTSVLKEENWAGIYPRQAQLKDTRTNKDANGVRIEKYRYLLEKEGTFTIEPITVVWWNAYLNKQYSRSSKKLTITVKPNPDLGMLATMRDSLSTSETVAPLDTKKTPYSLFGLSIKQFLILVLLIGIVLFLLRKLVKLIRRRQHVSKQKYLQSEKYWFDQLLKTHRENASQQLNALYNWLIRRHQKSYTLSSFAKETKSDNTLNLLESTFNNAGRKLSSQELKALRKASDNSLKNKKGELPPLNP